MSAEKRILVYKSQFKWIFISGLICGAALGTAIVEMWIRL
jgi:hypothetical protein